MGNRGTIQEEMYNLDNFRRAPDTYLPPEGAQEQRFIHFAWLWRHLNQVLRANTTWNSHIYQRRYFAWSRQNDRTFLAMRFAFWVIKREEGKRRRSRHCMRGGNGGWWQRFCCRGGLVAVWSIFLAAKTHIQGLDHEHSRPAKYSAVFLHAFCLKSKV